MGYITCLKMLNDVEDQTNKSLISDLEDYVEGKKREIDNKLNRPPDYRAQSDQRQLLRYQRPLLWQ